MKHLFKLDLTWAVLATVILSGLCLASLSLFVTHTSVDIPQEETVVYVVDGLEIPCDKRRGSQKNLCVGEYERGFPLVAGEGYVVGATDQRWNEQFDLRPVGFLVNWFIYSVIASPFVLLGWNMFRKGSE